jgi:mRNA interferase MazF
MDETFDNEVIDLPKVVNTVTDEERPECHRGDVFFADLFPSLGSEMGGIRPVVIVSNEVNNKFSPTVNVIPITSNKRKKPLPQHVVLEGEDSCLYEVSTVLTEQCRVIDKARLHPPKCGTLSDDVMKRIEHALMIQFGIITPTR